MKTGITFCTRNAHMLLLVFIFALIILVTAVIFNHANDNVWYVINKWGFIHTTSASNNFHSGSNERHILEMSDDPVFTGEIEVFLAGINGNFASDTLPELIKLSKGPYRYVSITPISFSDMSVVTFFNSGSLFTPMHILPLLFTMLTAFVFYMFASGALMRCFVFSPLNRLAESLLDTSSGEGDIFGCKREDEIGELAKTIMEMRGRLNAYNSYLYETTQKHKRQDQLLHAVNSAATVLLSSETEETFESSLHKGIELMALCMNFDCVNVWKNEMRDGVLHYVKCFEWKSIISQSRVNVPINTGYPYSKVSEWLESFLKGECINGPLGSLSQNMQTMLEPRNIKSLLLIPLPFHERLWGFISFDDYHSERFFSAEEVDILRSASLMMVNAILRNEMTHSLRASAERLEFALERAEAASRAKTNFLSNMSHEIRTPMNAIIGMTAIGKSSDIIEKKDNAFEKIESASSHLLDIINDILEMSKIEAGKFELFPTGFNLERLLQKVVDVISYRVDEKHQQLSVFIDKDTPLSLLGDDQRLAQVLTNLLSNAVKFTPDEGSIRLSVSLLNQENDRCTLKFEVKDTGIGISAEQQARLFTPFEQAESSTSRKFGGTGLGLAISRRIIELMEGEIRIESDLDKGATFIFTVQIRRSEENVENEKRPEHQSAFPGYRLLLVEDVVINQEIIQIMLEPFGLKIDCAANGIEALRIYTAQPDLYDLIFMDLQMPGMDGIEATRRIRAIEKERNSFSMARETSGASQGIPIIAMTANVFREDIEKCLDAGMNDHIGKPIDLNEVLQKLKNNLRPRKHGHN